MRDNANEPTAPTDKKTTSLPSYPTLLLTLAPLLRTGMILFQPCLLPLLGLLYYVTWTLRSGGEELATFLCEQALVLCLPALTFWFALTLTASVLSRHDNACHKGRRKSRKRQRQLLRSYRHVRFRPHHRHWSRHVLHKSYPFRLRRQGIFIWGRPPKCTTCPSEIPTPPLAPNPAPDPASQPTPNPKSAPDFVHKVLNLFEPSCYECNVTSAEPITFDSTERAVGASKLGAAHPMFVQDFSNDYKANLV
jgi:hypothetical protein